MAIFILEIWASEVTECDIIAVVWQQWPNNVTDIAVAVANMLFNFKDRQGTDSLSHIIPIPKSQVLRWSILSKTPPSLDAHISRMK